MSGRGLVDLWPHQRDLAQRIRDLPHGARLTVHGPVGVGKTTAVAVGLAARRIDAPAERWLIVTSHRALAHQWRHALAADGSVDARIVDPKWLRNAQLHGVTEAESAGVTYVCAVSSLRDESARGMLLGRPWDVVLIDGLRQLGPELRGEWGALVDRARVVVAVDESPVSVGDGWEHHDVLEPSVPGTAIFVQHQLELREEEYAVISELDELQTSVYDDAARFLVGTWLRLASSSILALDESVRRTVAQASDDLRPATDTTNKEPPLSPGALAILIDLLDAVPSDTRLEAAAGWISEQPESVVVMTDFASSARNLAWFPGVLELEPEVLTGSQLGEERSGRSSNRRVVIATAGASQGLEFEAARVLHLDLPPKASRLWARISRTLATDGRPVEHHLLVDPAFRPPDYIYGLSGARSLDEFRRQLQSRPAPRTDP